MTNGTYDKQPHSKACLAQAAAYILDKPIDLIFAFLGHDGRKDGFRTSEMAMLFHHFGHSYTWLEAVLVKGETPPIYSKLFDITMAKEKTGIIQVRSQTSVIDHALAKIDHTIINPATGTTRVGLGDKIVTGFAVIRRYRDEESNV